MGLTMDNADVSACHDLLSWVNKTGVIMSATGTNHIVRFDCDQLTKSAEPV